jgi:hypothetical protein
MACSSKGRVGRDTEDERPRSQPSPGIGPGGGLGIMRDLHKELQKQVVLSGEGAVSGALGLGGDIFYPPVNCGSMVGLPE